MNYPGSTLPPGLQGPSGAAYARQWGVGMGCGIFQAASFPESPFSAAFPQLQPKLQMRLCVSAPPLLSPQGFIGPQEKGEEQGGWVSPIPVLQMAGGLDDWFGELASCELFGLGLYD